MKDTSALNFSIKKALDDLVSDYHRTKSMSTYMNNAARIIHTYGSGILLYPDQSHSQINKIIEEMKAIEQLADQLHWAIMKIDNEDIKRMTAWCKENCRQEWNRVYHIFIFENKAEAALFKLYL